MTPDSPHRDRSVRPSARCLPLSRSLRSRLLQQAADAHRQPSICRRIAILPRPSRAPPPAGRPSAGQPSAEPNPFGSGKNVIRSSSPKEGKNDRSFRIRNDRISRRLAGQWPARIPPPYSAGPKLRRLVRLFLFPFKAATLLPRSPLRFQHTVFRSCCPRPGARPCRASAVPPNAAPPRV